MAGGNPFATQEDMSASAPRASRGWGFAEDLGRYWLPDPADSTAWEPGSVGAKHMPRGFMRMTNLVGAFEDTRQLAIWEQERALRGFAERPDLYAELTTMRRQEDGSFYWQEAINLFTKATRQGRADEASVIGTALHAVFDHRISGKVGPIGTPEMRARVEEIVTMIKDHLLKPISGMQERVVVNTHLKTAGRFDTGLKCVRTGRVLMADLKTKKKMFYSVLVQEAQLAGYARADAMWDEQQQCYVEPPPFDLNEGYILQLPQGSEDDVMRTEIKLKRLDLQQGWETACLARQIVDRRARAKSAPYLRSLVAELPARDTAYFLARLQLVESLSEGSAVLSLAAEHGVELPEHLIKEVVDNLTGAR